MFPRKARLTDPKLFALMTRAGTWQKGRYMSLRYLPVRGEMGKISFVMSKKVSKLANVRNRSKRRARAVFQELLKQTEFSPVAKKFHMLVIMHRPLTEVTHQEIRQEVISLVRGLQRKLTP